MSGMNLRPLWSFRLPKERQVGVRRPVVLEDRLLVSFDYERGGGYEATLIAFDAASGEERWRYAAGHVANEPVVCGAEIYWSTFGGGVHRLDAGGNLVWRAPDAPRSLWMPVVEGNRVVVAEIQGEAEHTWCLDRESGAERWRFRHGGHASALIVAEGHVFISAMGPPLPFGAPPRCSFHCVRLEDGRERWSVTGTQHFLDPVVVDGRVEVWTNRSLRTYAADDGKLLGETPLAAENRAFRMRHATVPGRRYVLDDSHGEGADVLTAVDVRVARRWLGRRERIVHDVAWRRPEPRGTCALPVELGADRLVYLTHDGALCLIDAGSGEPVGEKKLGSQRASSGGITVAGDRLFVTHGRSAFAFALAAS